MPCELKSECEDYNGDKCTDFYGYRTGCFREKLEADKGHAVLSNSTDLLSGNRPGVAEYLPGNDSRADLFEFDEQGALSFPCCSCTWKSEDQMKCVKCRHFAI